MHLELINPHAHITLLQESLRDLHSPVFHYFLEQGLAIFLDESVSLRVKNQLSKLQIEPDIIQIKVDTLNQVEECLRIVLHVYQARGYLYEVLHECEVETRVSDLTDYWQHLVYQYLILPVSLQIQCLVLLFACFYEHIQSLLLLIFESVNDCFYISLLINRALTG